MKGLVPTPKMDSIVAFKLTAEDRERLEEAAVRSGVSTSQFVRYALKRTIAQAEKHFNAA